MSSYFVLSNLPLNSKNERRVYGWQSYWNEDGRQKNGPKSTITTSRWTYLFKMGV